MSGKFKAHFPHEDDPHAWNEWVWIPFSPTDHHDTKLATILDDKLMELANDRRTAMFQKCEPLSAFWISLSGLAQICLTIFASAYRSETGFSSMTIIKTKTRNHLNARGVHRDPLWVTFTFEFLRFLVFICVIFMFICVIFNLFCAIIKILKFLMPVLNNESLPKFFAKALRLHN